MQSNAEAAVMARLCGNSYFHNYSPAHSRLSFDGDAYRLG